MNMNKTGIAVLPFAVALFFFSCSNNTADKNNSNYNDSIKKQAAVAKIDSSSKGDTSTIKHDVLESIRNGGSKDYTIALPPGWTIVTDTINKAGGRFLKMKAPLDGAGDQLNEVIAVITEKLIEPGLDNYFKNSKAGMQKNVPTILFSGEGNATINGIPAKWIRCSFLGNKMPYQLLMYLLVKDDVGFVITCTSDQKYYSKYEKLFRETINTFKLTK
jgi:hypothetical protein